MRLKGSLTVEASAVISICMIIIGTSIIFAFNLYRDSVDYINKVNVKEIDSVELFRKIRMGEAVIDWFKDYE